MTLYSPSSVMLACVSLCDHPQVAFCCQAGTGTAPVILHVPGLVLYQLCVQYTLLLAAVVHVCEAVGTWEVSLPDIGFVYPCACDDNALSIWEGVSIPA